MQPIEAITAPLLAQCAGVQHGFFTRLGGVSTGIYASLNCGLGSGDDPENVRINRGRVSQQFGPQQILLAGTHQEHGKQVHIIRSSEQAGLRPKADGLVSAVPGIGLSILAADCAPVLFADAGARIIGCAHAGWRGALAGICEAVVEAMLALGAGRAAICAAIGPCISQTAYEVDADFERNFLEQDSASAAYFAPGASAGKRQFALGPYVGGRIARAGVGRIERLDLCTYASEYAGERRFFSFRRATHRGDADYGRNISVIALA